jgi:hypothetical protein
VKYHEMRLNPFDHYIDEGCTGKRKGHGHTNSHEQEETYDKSQGAH